MARDKGGRTGGKPTEGGRTGGRPTEDRPTGGRPGGKPPGDAREAIARGLGAKIAIDRERSVIRQTIGEIFRIKHFTPGRRVDAADIYRCMGGQAEFTARLFAEAFGSESLKVEGILSDPARDEPNQEIKATLAKVAVDLNRQGVPGVVRGFAAPVEDAREGIFSGDYSCISFSSAAGGVGPELPEDIKTWVFVGV